MTSYIISYDLRNPGKNYTTLIEKIKQFNFAKVCESTWIIKAQEDSINIRDELKKYVDSNDRIFVAALKGEAAWLNAIDSIEKVKSVL